MSPVRVEGAETPIYTSAKRLVAQVVGYGVARVIPTAGNVVLTLVLARTLGPAQYGEFALVAGIVAVLMVVGYGWLSSSAYRFSEESSYAEVARARFLGTVATCYLVTVLMTLAGVWFLLNRGAPSAVESRPVLALLTVVWLAGEALIELCLNLARAEGRVGWYLAILATLWPAKVGIVAIAIVAGPVDTIVVVAALALSCFVGALPYLASRAQHVSLRMLRPSASLIPMLATYGIPVAAGGVVASLLALSDRYLVQHYLTLEALGVYAASYQLASSAVLLPASTVMLPGFTLLIKEYERSGLMAVAPTLERLSVGLTLVAAPAAVCVGIAAPSLLELFFGAPYREGAVVTRWVTVGMLLLAVSEYFEKSFQLLKRPLVILWCQVGALLVNFGLNVVLIPRIGIAGAGVATAIAYGVYLCAVSTMSLRLLQWRLPFGTFGVVTLACALGFVAALAVHGGRSPVEEAVKPIFLFAGVYLLVLALARKRLIQDWASRA